MEKQHKNNRTLDMYVRLCEGKSINKREEAKRFGVDERSIQRDLDDIRAFLSGRAESAGDTREVVYDRAREGFVMTGSEEGLLDNDEIFAVSKILLESRAFTKKEIGTILDKLVSGCVPQKNMKLVSDLISNEKYHYVELNHKSALKNKLWVLGEKVKQCRLMEITYKKEVSSKEIVKRVIEPVGLVFSEYYFYLNAFIVEKNEEGKYVQIYDYPTVFRIDRIKSYKDLDETFKIPYMDRFEEGEFRKRVQFMFPGTLTYLQFRFTGNSIEAILDRIPTAKVVSESKKGCVIEAEVYGTGILMWLLSQGKNVEVIKPKSMREEMKKILQETLSNY
ncbi:MAG: WYL domain-containing protein [Lachnospiraceae bacterium]|nr:WYL domain-containing protein [Lachnospiraceae bacterium]